jgi:hypothetical protein
MTKWANEVTRANAGGRGRVPVWTLWGPHRSVSSFGKMILRLSITVLLVGLLTACDPVYGPGLANGTSRVVKFTAAFSGNPQELELQPGHEYVQRHPNMKLEALTVRNGDLTKQFSPAELAAAFSESAPKRGHWVILQYLDGGRLHGTTWQELHGANR